MRRVCLTEDSRRSSSGRPYTPFLTEVSVAQNRAVFDAVGGRGLQRDHPTQRAWRDVAAVNHHISLNYDAVMSMYGQHLFGLPPEGQF